jgi:hypothetical protein
VDGARPSRPLPPLPCVALPKWAAHGAGVEWNLHFIASSSFAKMLCILHPWRMRKILHVSIKVIFLIICFSA